MLVFNDDRAPAVHVHPMPDRFDQRVLRDHRGLYAVYQTPQASNRELVDRESNNTACPY